MHYKVKPRQNFSKIYLVLDGLMAVLLPPLSVILRFMDLNTGFPVPHPFITNLIVSGIFNPVEAWESDYDPFIRAQYCPTEKLYRTSFVCGRTICPLSEIGCVTLSEMLHSFSQYKTDCEIITDEEYIKLTSFDDDSDEEFDLAWGEFLSEQSE